MRVEAFHPRQLPLVLKTFSDVLHRPIGAAHMRSVELGHRLRHVATPLATVCRERATQPGFSAWPESAADALGTGLTAMGGGFAAKGDVFHLSFTWGFLGPIRLEGHTDLVHAIDLARSWAQECAVCSADGRNGFWLEYEPVYAERGDPYPFELVVWGEWQNLARRLLPFELAAQEA